jgi:hypothetical protein
MQPLYDEQSTETATQDLIGPYVGMKIYQQIHNTYHASRWASDEEKAMSICELGEGLKQAFEMQRSYDPNYAKGGSFVDILAEAKKDIEIRKIKVYSQSVAQRKQRNALKFKKVQDIHFCLVEAVGEMDGKNTILDCVWNNPDDSWYNKYCTPVQYSCALTRFLMERLVSAPASASKKAIKHANEQICQVFESFEENNFFSLPFFDQDERWNRALRDLCTEKVSEATFWSKVKVGPHFLALVSEGRFADVLAHYLQCSEKKPILTEVFARMIHDTDPSSHEHFPEQEFRLLAKNYCAKFCGGFSISNVPCCLTLAGLTESLEIKCRSYLSMKEDLFRLFESSQFRTFIENSRPWQPLSNLLVFKRSIINVPIEYTIDQESFLVTLRQLASDQNRGGYETNRHLRGYRMD